MEVIILCNQMLGHDAHQRLYEVPKGGGGHDITRYAYDSFYQICVHDMQINGRVGSIDVIRQLAVGVFLDFALVTSRVGEKRLASCICPHSMTKCSRPPRVFPLDSTMYFTPGVVVSFREIHSDYCIRPAVQEQETLYVLQLKKQSSSVDVPRAPDHSRNYPK